MLAIKCTQGITYILPSAEDPFDLFPGNGGGEAYHPLLLVFLNDLAHFINHLSDKAGRIQGRLIPRTPMGMPTEGYWDDIHGHLLYVFDASRTMGEISNILGFPLLSMDQQIL